MTSERQLSAFLNSAMQDARKYGGLSEHALDVIASMALDTIATARQDEREACARVAENCNYVPNAPALSIAAAIRARKDEP